MVTVAGCGAAAVRVGVGSTTTRGSTTSGSTTRPASTTSGAATSTSSLPPTAVCAAAALVGGQAPLSSGLGTSASAWSLSNSGSIACELPAGRPRLAFVDASGHTVAHYTVTRLGGSSGRSIRLVPGGRAWFLTRESTTTCGVGATIAGGPFHYDIGLPGGAGTVAWAPGYLSGATLSDFCADVALSIGDLSGTEPSAT